MLSSEGMMWLLQFSCLLCGLALAEETISSADYVISHSFDGIHFTPRQGFNYNQLPIETRGNGIDQEFVEKFKELLKNNGFYSIQINFQQKNLSSIPISASIRACDLQKSGFKEDISLHANRDNNIIGVQYTSPVIALPRPCDPSKIPSEKLNFHTKVKLREPVTSQVIPIQVNGPRPPYLQNVNLGVEDLAQEKKPQSQSFFMKYWYIIVPVLLMSLLSGGGDPPPGEGAAAGAPAAGATAPKK